MVAGPRRSGCRRRMLPGVLLLVIVVVFAGRLGVAVFLAVFLAVVLRLLCGGLRRLPAAAAPLEVEETEKQSVRWEERPASRAGKYITSSCIISARVSTSAVVLPLIS